MSANGRSSLTSALLAQRRNGHRRFARGNGAECVTRRERLTLNDSDLAQLGDFPRLQQHRLAARRIPLLRRLVPSRDRQTLYELDTFDLQRRRLQLRTIDGASERPTVTTRSVRRKRREILAQHELDPATHRFDPVTRFGA